MAWREKGEGQRKNLSGVKIQSETVMKTETPRERWFLHGRKKWTETNEKEKRVDSELLVKRRNKTQIR